MPKRPAGSDGMYNSQIMAPILYLPPASPYIVFDNRFFHWPHFCNFVIISIQLNIYIMKLHFNRVMIIAAATAAMAAACTGVKKNKAEVVADAANTAASKTDLRGQWAIENIVFNDSDYVRPDEAVPGTIQYIVFDDSTYSIMTNCNTISGSYTVNGDSITLHDGLMTEMACDNMETEDALRRILPDIASLDVQNDSVVRLNGKTPAECILLRKIKTPIK